MAEAVFNPDMLRLARDAREATQDDLAKLAGVTQALMSKIEHGLAQPSDEVIEKLSDGLRFPREFFYQHERAVGFPHFHYRKRSKLGAKPLGRIGAMINIRRQHISKLVRSFDFEASKPIPQIDLDQTGLTPEQVAARLREYWMLPRGPVHSVAEIVETAGAVVIPSRFATNQLDGLSFRSDGVPPLLFLNRDVPGDRFRFSLAHELGHIVMHTSPESDEDMEEQANRFAAAFLMPPDDIRPYFATMKFSTLTRLKPFWKVSIKAMIKRAHDLKLLTDYQYKSMNIEYNKLYRDGEPDSVPMEEPAQLKRMVRHHVEHLGYSSADLAKMLCANEDDLIRAYFDRPRLRIIASNDDA